MTKHEELIERLDALARAARAGLCEGEAQLLETARTTLREQEQRIANLEGEWAKIETCMGLEVASNTRLRAENTKLRKAVALLNSMVEGGEYHSEQSRAIVRRALSTPEAAREAAGSEAK